MIDEIKIEFVEETRFFDDATERFLSIFDTMVKDDYLRQIVINAMTYEVLKKIKKETIWLMYA